MTDADLAAAVDAAWEAREGVSPATGGAVRDAVEAALDGLDTGRLRVAEKTPRGWQVHQWLKKAVLLSFRLNDMVEIQGGPVDPERGAARWWDKVPSKFAGWSSNRFRDAGFRAVPGAIVRRSAFIAPNVVLMPSFVNVGAHVGAGTMVDTWATVGSCAQIGANCHLSGGVGIGGVLEPLQAEPVIIEDNCFIGARSEVVEGVVVEEGAVLAMGTFISATTRIVDRNTGQIHVGPRPGLFGRRPRLLSRPPAPRRQPRPQPLLRRHRQDRRRADPRQDRDQRIAARMKNTSLDPAALAAALIRRPSVTPKDEGAIGVVAASLEALGFACHPLTFEGGGSDPIRNLYARYGVGRPNLCFAGHTDVVPTGAADSWSFDPFAALLRDGALCGRGAVDMKGAIAAFVCAAQRFLGERGPGFTGSISLLITGDEEGEAVNGTKKVLDWLADRGEALDGCLVGEPTSAEKLGDMVKIGRRGSLTGRLTVHGVQGHTAYPHLADNAAHRLIEMLHALTTAELDQGSGHFQPSTLQVSTIDIGNPAANVVPATARAVFNIRFNDLWTGAALRQWLAEQLDRSGGKYALEVRVSGESFLTPPGRVSQCLDAAIRRVTGHVPELSTTGGTSDARFIQACCPVAEFGLVGQTMHKVDERVELADLAALTEIYHAFLDLYFDRP